MNKTTQNNQRSLFGYGSSYRKAGPDELRTGDEIPSVLKGRTWMIKPDKKVRTKHPCIWMQAGVVDYKKCNHFYDCTTCKYDLGMKKNTERGKQISWQDAMRKKSDLERVCRHSLTHRIESRRCAYDYQCKTCDFDQLLEDVWAAKVASSPLEVEQVRGFDVPMGYHYHNGHTWARIERGGLIRIGMDDFAFKVLGRADGFDFPLIGNELGEGCVGWGFKRNNHQADVLSPVNGVIVEVNSKVKEQPRQADDDPFGNGWLFLVHNRNAKKTVGGLMADQAGLNWMRGEVEKLEEMVEAIAGPLATDGGYLQPDVFGNLPQIGWKTLTGTFLKT